MPRPIRSSAENDRGGGPPRIGPELTSRPLGWGARGPQLEWERTSHMHKISGVALPVALILAGVGGLGWIATSTHARVEPGPSAASSAFEHPLHCASGRTSICPSRGDAEARRSRLRSKKSLTKPGITKSQLGTVDWFRREVTRARGLPGPAESWLCEVCLHEFSRKLGFTFSA